MRTFNIVPADKYVEKRADALNIVNEFKKRGFKNETAFINIVVECDPTFNNFENMMALRNFWYLRRFNNDTNTALNKVIEQLKAE